MLGNVGMGLHHKLCHTLGGSFNLPHAEMHTVVLPHALAYNAPAAPRGDGAHRARARRATARSRGARACRRWRARHGAPVALRDIGMPADGLDRAADSPCRRRIRTRAPLERAALRALLQRAFDGAPPRT